MSKCEHVKRKSRCVVCGGSEICPHLRIKYNINNINIVILLVK